EAATMLSRSMTSAMKSSAIVSLLLWLLLAADAHAQVDLRQRLKRVGPAYKLVVDNSLIQDSDLEQFQDVLYKNVVILSMNGTSITNQGLRNVQKLPHLRTLNISGTKVNDEGIAYLKNMTTLKELDLSNTKCSDLALEHFKDLSLKKLNLEGTAVTDF